MDHITDSSFTDCKKEEFKEKIAEIAKSVSITSLQAIVVTLETAGCNVEEQDRLTLVNQFREELSKRIMKDLLSTYDRLEMGQNLFDLELFKEKFKHTKGTKQWRPSEKTAEEQLRPHTVMLLQWKKQYYTEQLNQQKPQFLKLLENITQYRDYVDGLSQKISSRRIQIDAASKVFDQIDQKLKDLTKQV